MRRVRHAFLIIIGRTSRSALLTMELAMALEKTNTAIAELNTAASRVIDQLQASEQSSAQATSDLASADASTAAAIQPVIDALNNAVPPVLTDLPSA